MQRAPGRIITFYSYKGGTGRSMALANVAWILASNGKRVLAVDWDLEAPGLHRYFTPFLVDKTLTASDGVIDFVIDYTTEAMTPSQEGEVVPRDWYVQYADLPRYAASLEWEGWDFPGDGTLDFVSAGRQGPSYPTRVNTFDWQSFYDRQGGGVFLEAAREKMREEYDYILIDSRTGVSDTSGICAVQMPDLLVVCFTLNNQSIDGAAAIAGSVYRERGGSPGFQIFPVPMRIETAEKAKLEARREYARRRFALYPDHLDGEERETYWGAVEMPYVPFYAYEEVLAAFGDRPGSPVSLLGAAERLASYLTAGEVQRLVPAPDPVRQEVLAAYSRPADETPKDERLRLTETAFAGLPAAEQLAARSLLTRLVRLEPDGSEARPRVPLGELEPYRRLVHLFQSTGMLAVEADPSTHEQTVQLADEGLTARWQRLRSWIDEDRDFLLWRQGLQGRLAEWRGGRGDSRALLSGAALQAAGRWRNTHGEQLTDSERAYLRKSRWRQNNRRIAAAVVILLIAGLLGAIAVRTWRSQDATRAVLEAQKLAGDGKPDRALQKYGEAIALNPKLQDAYMGRARLYEQKGDYGKALADLAKSLELDPSSQSSLLEKAVILAQTGDTPRAISTLQQAVSRDPKNVLAYRNLGILYDSTGNTDAAIDSYVKAIAGGDKDEGTYFNRGLAYVGKGERSQAVADFEHVFQNTTDDRLRSAAQAQLSKLGYESPTKAQGEGTRVYLQYQDPKDAEWMKYLAYALKKHGFEIGREELVSPKAETTGDARYFFARDKASAAEVQKIVEDELARAGFPLQLDLLSRDAKSFQGSRPGRIEVWLPPLSKSTRYVRKSLKE
jgi:tetratricopeptide (TPR) repeat protein